MNINDLVKPKAAKSKSKPAPAKKVKKQPINDSFIAPPPQPMGGGQMAPSGMGGMMQ